MPRDYKYIDIDQINEDIDSGKAESINDDPNIVLYETILDLLQLAESEGMSEEEVDEVVRRVNDYRAERCRSKFRLHTPDD